MIIINKTKNSPEMKFENNEDVAIATIAGESWPDNAPATYKPLLSFIEKSSSDDNIKKIKLIFSLSYHNTSTAKIFIVLIDLLNSIFAKGKGVKVIWEVLNNDSDLVLEAEDLLETAIFGYEIKN